MYTMPDTMPRPKPSGPTDNFQFRMKAEEFEVWKSLWKKAKERNHYLSKTEFNRMLVGLIDDDTYVTAQDRSRFLAVGRGRAEMMGAAPPAPPRIRQVPTSDEVVPRKKRAR